jgi:RimJ/RimL family protein N-acetyltransferase
MIIRAATTADIPSIMALERGEGFEPLVGRWEAAAHAAEMDRSDSRYFIAEANEPLGFVMLQDLGERHGNVLLRRIAVAKPGAGVGQALLRHAAAFVFAQPTPHRLYLRAHAGNARAIAAYVRAGFMQEGVEREGHLHTDGGREDNVIMSMLRHDWG